MSTGTDALTALARVLTPDETAAIKAYAVSLSTSWDGAEPADWIDAADQADAYLDRIEPFFEAHLGHDLKWHFPELRGAKLGGVRYALYALIALGQDLTVANVVRLLTRAGLIPAALDWEQNIMGWVAHGRENDYLVSDDTYGRVHLTRWVPLPGGAEPGGPTVRLIAEVLFNAVTVPGEQAGKDMAQAHEDAPPAIGVRGWRAPLLSGAGRRTSGCGSPTGR
jgi:hypothetical protein